MEEITKEAIREHIEDEAKARKEQAVVNNEMGTFKAETEGSLSDLHRKADTILKQQEDTMAFMQNVTIGVGIFKFSWNNAGKIGSLLLLIGGLIVFLKVGFLGAVAWLAGNNPIK